MKVTVKKPTEIDVEAIRVCFQPRYDGEEGSMPTDFPLRTGPTWTGTINILNGRILDWPADKTGEYEFYEKVCDTGSYTLLGPKGDVVSERIQDYVPRMVPGEYGDYIHFKIKDGRITNWDRCSESDIEQFFEDE